MNENFDTFGKNLQFLKLLMKMAIKNKSLLQWKQRQPHIYKKIFTYVTKK